MYFFVFKFLQASYFLFLFRPSLNIGTFVKSCWENPKDLQCVQNPGILNLEYFQ